MDNLTYDLNGTTHMLETYEWDNLWWEYANDSNNTDRILLIGDSISVGYRGIINELYKKNIFADGLGTSKSVDNPLFKTLITYFAGQFKNYKLVQINNGLHGWHLSPEEYEKYYTELVQHVIKEFPDSKIVIAITTYVSKNRENSDEDNIRIGKLNEAALRIAEKYNLVVNDLSEIANGNSELYIHDGIHPTDETYQLLASQCKKIIDKLLEG